MRSDETQVKKAVEKLGKNINKAGGNQDKNLTVLSNEFFKNGHMPRDIFNLNDRQVETLYAQAYNFYQMGRYFDAIQIFRLLIILNVGEVKYVLGLASCMHMMKEFKNAADIYTFCTILDPENPIPFYHMSDCFLEMKDPHSAYVSLEMAIKKAGIKPEFQVLKDRAAITLQNLRNKIK